MKKFILCAFAALALSTTTYAQTDNNTSSFQTTPNGKELIGTYGLGYYSYDGGENYGLSAGMYTVDGFGFGLNIRSNFKFKEYQSTVNGDILLNYSFGVYSKDDMRVLITPEIGPSFASRAGIKNGELKDDQFFIDGFVGIKATLAYKKFTISAGYHMWAPKWKFGKEKADGFYAQLGFDF